MVQDGEPEQEMLVVEEQEQFPPQMDLEPEMGAAAAYDTSPPPPPKSSDPSRTERGRYNSAGNKWNEDLNGCNKS